MLILVKKIRIATIIEVSLDCSPGAKCVSHEDIKYRFKRFY